VLGPATPEVLDYQLVAVVAGSSHEAYLKAFFPKARIAPFENAALARLALKDGRVNALFGDAVSLSFWLNGAEAEGCCAFSNNAYVDAKFFGDGLGIAVKKGATPLRRSLDYALARLAQRGVYAELFLKYFRSARFKGFSSELETGSRYENASRQTARSHQPLLHRDADQLQRRPRPQLALHQRAGVGDGLVGKARGVGDFREAEPLAEHSQYLQFPRAQRIEGAFRAALVPAETVGDFRLYEKFRRPSPRATRAAVGRDRRSW